jgi:hypothetical protein
LLRLCLHLRRPLPSPCLGSRPAFDCLPFSPARYFCPRLH